MGTFRIVIEAVGGHGQDREKKDGEVVDFNAGGLNTPDSLLKTFVMTLAQTDVMVNTATITHWPEQECSVTDDLLTGKRHGNF